MQRRTITVDPISYVQIQKMRAGLLTDGLDVSFTLAANLVLYGGLIATDKFTDEDWRMIQYFLKHRGPALELDALTDQRADIYLANLRRLDELDEPTDEA